MDAGRVGLGISLIALIVAVAGIAYVNQSLTGVPSQLSAMNERLNQIEAATTAQVKRVESDLKSVADATGVQLGEAETLRQQIELRKLIQAAEAEGKVIFYGLAQDVPPALAKGFQSKYPKITVDYLGGHGATLAKKFRDELAAGVATADV